MIHQIVNRSPLSRHCLTDEIETDKTEWNSGFIVTIAVIIKSFDQVRKNIPFFQIQVTNKNNVV